MDEKQTSMSDARICNEAFRNVCTLYVLGKRRERGEETRDEMFILGFLRNNKSKHKLQFIEHERVEVNSACGAERKLRNAIVCIIDVSTPSGEEAR
jgi:hypothetical protein